MQIPVSPMLALKVEAPSGTVLPGQRAPVLQRQGFVFEPKWDGHRLTVATRQGRVSVWTRSLRNVTDEWPEIASMFEGLRGEYVFDGELLMLNASGRPSIEALGLAKRLTRQQRLERTRFAAFDLLEEAGNDLQRDPYSRRRQALVEVHEALLPPTVLVTPATPDGVTLWNAIIEQNMEGVIAKPVGSPYLQGERGTWLKLKSLQRCEFLVIGYTAGEGSRAGAFGAIVLGEVGVDGLVHYAGKCGTGWNDRTSDELMDLMRPLVTPDPPLERVELLRVKQKIGPREVTWVRPSVRGIVEFQERSADGIPRFPAWKGVAVS